MIKQVLQAISSLKLTVVLLCLSMLLVFGGTGAQRYEGIWQVQDRYFHSYYVVALFRDLKSAALLDHVLPAGLNIPGGIPMPGGYVLGMLMLVNLVAAFIMRTQYSWNRVGLILSHLGIIFLLVGEGITSGMASEGHMMIEQGGSSNYVSGRNPELAIIDTSPADKDRQVVIPVELVGRAGTASSDSQKTITDPKLPFAVRVDRFHPNSEIVAGNAPEAKGLMRATAGEAKEVVAIPRPQFSGAADAEKNDVTSAYVTFLQNGKELGRYLLCSRFPGGQTLQADGKTYLVSLRPARSYKPYAMHLIKFAHDKYLGTQMARNYSSKLRFVDPTHNEDREILIKMNEPFRYRGETFYQSSFVGDTVTILQVVRNPAWTLPYIACTVGGAGLCLHFFIMLVGFLKNRAAGVSLQLAALKADRSQAPGKPWFARAEVMLPLGMALLSIFIMGVHLAPRGTASAFDIKGFSTLPVTYEGRIQPLDSLARNTMKVMRLRESTTIADKSNPAVQKTAPAIQWLLDALAKSPETEDYKVFRIDFPDVVNLLGLSRSEQYFSVRDVSPGVEKLMSQAQAADAIAEKDRSQFQVQVLEQSKRFSIFMGTTQLRNLLVAAPLAAGEQWTTGEPLERPEGTAKIPDSLKRVDRILSAYHDGKTVEFNRQVADYHQVLDRALPAEMAKVRFEAFFNHFDPFMVSKELYIFAFLAALISWLVWTEPLRKSGLAFLIFAVVLHTFGLFCRMYISGRPPVTNLASSAIFIGWACAAMALFLELIYRNGLGIAVAGVIAWPTLFIADQLSLDGDTMKVLMAVLDTNIWLATHVVVITLGYAATFLAGALGCAYIFFGLCTPLLNDTWRKGLIRAVYGVTGFAMIGSFVGTVLGGIWADQSWGRFWGWDPKENGAVLIVLANAILLHAKWAGWAKYRGLAGLAVAGNIVTAWSWFGTNLLGVGLHSYGFMAGAAIGLGLFVFSQLVLIGMAFVPEKAWLSLQRYPATPDLPVPAKAV